MISRNTLKTKEISYETLTGKERINLEYSILEKKDESDIVYGIEIIKDKKEYQNAMVSNSKKQVEDLINIFYENEVTPSTLIEILNDLSF